MAASSPFVVLVQVTDVQVRTERDGPGEVRDLASWRVRVLAQRRGDKSLAAEITILAQADGRLEAEPSRIWTSAEGGQFVVGLDGPDPSTGAFDWSSAVSYLPLDPGIAAEVARAREASPDPDVHAFGVATRRADPAGWRQRLVG